MRILIPRGLELFGELCEMVLCKVDHFHQYLRLMTVMNGMIRHGFSILKFMAY